MIEREEKREESRGKRREDGRSIMCQKKKGKDIIFWLSMEVLPRAAAVVVEAGMEEADRRSSCRAHGNGVLLLRGKSCLFPFREEEVKKRTQVGIYLL